MKPKRKYLEHTADVLFEAEADNLNELFEQCALAVEESQIDLKDVTTSVEKKIKGENEKVDYLLFDFLDDLLLYKDSEQLIFSKFIVKVVEEKGKFKLDCTAYGEKLNKKHEQKVDVKAITMHLFKVEKVDNKWTARVLIDI